MSRYSPPLVVTADPLELGYMAGLYEGEGTSSVSGHSKAMAIVMTNEEAVRRFFSYAK